MTSIAFLCETSGLANRIRGLISYRALSQVLNSDFFLCWSPDPACDATFETLFAPQRQDCELVDRDTIRERERCGDVKVFTHADWWDDIWEAQCRGMVAWEVYFQHVVENLRALKFDSAILDRAARFVAEHHVTQRAGFHIRHTDNLTTYEHWASHSRGSFDPKLVSETESFLNFAEDCSSRCGLYLATDDQDIERLWRARFVNANLVTTAKDYHPRQYGHPAARSTSVFDAAVDLAILASCKFVVGTYYSSFARIGAAIGGRSYLEIQGKRCVKDPVLPSRARLSRNSDFDPKIARINTFRA
jgi:hypothetical protein